MKKIIIALSLVLVASMLLVSCAKDVVEENNNDIVENNGENNTENNDETTATVLTLEELQAATAGIYEKSPVPFMAGDIPAEMINDESFAYYTGLEDSSKISAVNVSESMIGSQAYSLVLVSVKEGEDVNAVADAMINGIDQRKWMCVEADLIRTVVSGNTVMLIMIDSEMQLDINSFVDAFVEVVGAIDYEATKK